MLALKMLAHNHFHLHARLSKDRSKDRKALPQHLRLNVNGDDEPPQAILRTCEAQTIESNCSVSAMAS